jgi:hypothetical protein
MPWRRGHPLRHPPEDGDLRRGALTLTVGAPTPRQPSMPKRLAMFEPLLASAAARRQRLHAKFRIAMPVNIGYNIFGPHTTSGLCPIAASAGREVPALRTVRGEDNVSDDDYLLPGAARMQAQPGMPDPQRS